MEERFYESKRQSKFNVGIVLSLLLGTVFIATGEFLEVLTELVLQKLFPGPWVDSLEIALFGFLGIAVVVLLWARCVEESPWQALGLKKKNMWKDFFLGWGIGIGLLVGTVFLMAIFGSVRFEKVIFSWNLLGRFLILVLAWSVQASTEELLTRGWMFSSLAAKKSIKTGIFVSSLFFMLMHMGNEGMGLIPVLDLFLYAVLASLYMLKTNSLWGVCGIHAAWNCFQGNVFAFPVSGTNTGDAFIQVTTHGPTWISGGIFGVEGSFMSVLVQLFFVLWLIYDLSKKKEELSVKEGA